jgi:hypothetical protein
MHFEPIQFHFVYGLTSGNCVSAGCLFPSMTVCCLMTLLVAPMASS